MIHPDAIRYFIELARTLHMSRAADRLGVTQPTLSHSLKRLEEFLGQSLFVRSKRGLKLTSAGERVLEKSQDFLQCWEGIADAVTDEVEGVKGRIRLGCHSAVAQYMLPPFLPDLLRENPEIRVTLAHGLSRHMTEMVVSGKLDVALVVNPKPHPDLVVKELGRDRVTVWIPVGCLNPDVLMIEPDLLQTQDILVKLAKKRIRFRRILETSSLEVMAQLLAAKTGAAILPERVLKAFENTGVRQMSGAPTFEDRICVIYKPEFRSLQRGKVFLEKLKSHQT